MTDRPLGPLLRHQLFGPLPASVLPAERCRRCDKPIEAYELCGDCAQGNDPFEQSKYSWGARGPY